MNRLIHQSILAAILLAAVAILAIATPNSNIASAHEEPAGLCSRNQAVQDSVLAKLPGINQCSGVTGEHLRGLSGTLDISGQGITPLSAADFHGMSGITGIDASGNQLSSVPRDLLQQLRHQSHTHSTTENSRNGYVIAVIDKSGSMSGELSAAKSGARWLAANRPDSMPMAVVAFSDTAHTAQDFTTETDSYTLLDEAQDQNGILQAIDLIIDQVHAGKAVRIEMPGGGVMLMPRLAVHK